MYRYPPGPGRNMSDVPMPGVGGGMLSVPYDMSGMPLRDAGVPQPIPIGTLATALANATPEQQRTVCFRFLLLMLILFIIQTFTNFCVFII